VDVSDRERVGKKGRQERILVALGASPAVRISSLASQFGVSTETIRRDLEEMGESGLVNRTYGGAVARPFGFEPWLGFRVATMTEEREKIGELAAGLVQSGEAIMIDGGATTLDFAHRLVTKKANLTVVTNSLAAAVALGKNPGFRVIACPGVYDYSEGIVAGPDTIAFISRFRANRVFISASGVTVEGPTDVHQGAAAVKRAMIARATERNLLVDHTKFDQPNLEVVCPLSDLSRLISDMPPPAGLASALSAAGTEVLY
jgi:DeoR family transcriptional regulator, glycerol-3-phosphate regulon repressor